MFSMLLWSLWFRFSGIVLCPILNLYCLIKGKDKYPKWAYTLDNDEDGFTGDKRGWYSDYLKDKYTRESLRHRLRNAAKFVFVEKDSVVDYFVIYSLMSLYLPFYLVYCVLCSFNYWQEYLVYKNGKIEHCDLFTRLLWTVRWCWRNQAFNHRYNDKCSICVNPNLEPTFKIISIEGNTYHHEQRYSFEPNKIEKKWYKFVFEVKGKRYTSEFSLTPLNSEEYTYKRKGLKVYPCFYFDKWWIDKIKNEGWPKYKDRAVYSSIKRVRKYKEEGA